MKKYKCIKSFGIDVVDGDGFYTEETNYIKVDSLWEMDESEFRVTDGEIRLVELEGMNLGWIEIPNETLDECFKEIK